MKILHGLLFIGLSLIPLYSQELSSPDPITAFGGEKSLIITIDDGYDFDMRILDYIKANKIAVTALVNGDWATDNPEIIRQLNTAGVELGLHSHSHVNITELDNNTLRQQIQSNADAIRNAGVQPAPFYRPPYGISNSRTNKIISDAGYHILLFNTTYSTADFVDSWSLKYKKERLAANLENAEGGIIILLHFGHRDSYEMLRFVVEWADMQSIPLKKASDYIDKDINGK